MLQQLVIDAYGAELVLDDREFLAVRLSQEVVQQRGLSAAEEAGEHGHGNAVVLLVSHGDVKDSDTYRTDLNPKRGGKVEELSSRK